MANHPSAIKRTRQNEKRRIRNKALKTRVKNVVKNVKLDDRGASKPDAIQALRAAQSVIDQAVKKGVIHQNTAARKISRLSKHINTKSA